MTGEMRVDSLACWLFPPEYSYRPHRAPVLPGAIQLRQSQFSQHKTAFLKPDSALKDGFQDSHLGHNLTVVAHSVAVLDIILISCDPLGQAIGCWIQGYGSLQGHFFRSSSSVSPRHRPDSRSTSRLIHPGSGINLLADAPIALQDERGILTSSVLAV